MLHPSNLHSRGSGLFLPRVYPYMMRKWFKQYKNVAVSEDFDLIYGDHGRLLKDVIYREKINTSFFVVANFDYRDFRIEISNSSDRGSSYRDLEENYEDGGTEIQIHVDTILENPRLDFKLEFFYSDIWLHVYSPRAIREMIALTPKKIDRSDYEKLNFGKLSAYSFEKQRTSKEWKIRREAATKHTPIKRPNDHIKMMLEEIKYGSRKWKSGKTVDITEFLNDLSIEILCMALFGSDFFEESGKCPYINKKNKIKKMDLPEAILYTSDDIDNSYENPMSHHFPMVNEKSLGKPYKRDKKNIQEIQKFLSNYLKFKGILKDGFHHKFPQITEEQVVNDYLNVIDAANYTLDIGLVSCLFRLKQNPHVQERLVEELKICGITSAINDKSLTTAMLSE